VVGSGRGVSGEVGANGDHLGHGKFGRGAQSSDCVRDFNLNRTAAGGRRAYVNLRTA
jgi:hypothetical protein